MTIEGAGDLSKSPRLKDSMSLSLEVPGADLVSCSCSLMTPELTSWDCCKTPDMQRQKWISRVHQPL